MPDRFPVDPAAFLKEMQRRDFGAFLDKAWPWISGGELLDWNWHLDAIGYELGRIVSGDNRRLIVNLPPRNAKSKVISVIWVAWLLGVRPTMNIVCASYSNELSGKLARDCLAIMQSPWYRELFPRTIISRTRSAAHDFETTAGGGRIATSITGSLTGRGGDIIILDDVIKPEEANSDVTREKVNDWFRSTLISRLNNKKTGAILCVMQRLHQYDLPGMLLEAGGWELLSIPAIAPCDQVIPLTRGRVYRRKEGDVLHPAREPLAILEEYRASMGSDNFAAQYLQDPAPAVGNIIKAAWLKEWEGPDDGFGEVIQSWDTAIKTGQNNAFSVCVTARVRGQDVRVIDVWRGRVEFPELKRKAIELAQLWHPETVLIEDKASGQQLIQSLRAEQDPWVSHPIARTPDLDKVSRVSGVSAMIEAEQLHLPREARWLADFRAELLTFPNGRFDDQVDALTQLLEWVRMRRSVDRPINVGPTLFWIGEDGGVYSSDDEDYENHHVFKGDPWGPGPY